MTGEHDRTIDALKVAIQMETDGKEFYNRAAEASSNPLGRKLLATLAAEEDIHRNAFISIYDGIRSRRGWPKLDIKPDSRSSLRTLFSQATEGIETQVRSQTGELEAVKTARAMEAKTYDYYREQMRQATEPAEKEFYENVASQEQEHNLVLADYEELLRDPAAWFVKKEHPSLD